MRKNYGDIIRVIGDTIISLKKNIILIIETIRKGVEKGQVENHVK